MPPETFYNRNGRGYPDISAAAHNFIVYVSGAPFAVDGTSASTPVMASMIALINEARLSLGKPPMGFLNPWLYHVAATHPEAFVDIVSGENNCTADQSNCCQFGFRATRGWDATTGLGTPNFVTLRNIAIAPHQPFPDATYIQIDKYMPASARIWLLAAIGLIAGVIILLAIFTLIRTHRPAGYEELRT